MASVTVRQTRTQTACSRSDMSAYRDLYSLTTKVVTPVLERLWLPVRRSLGPARRELVADVMITGTCPLRFSIFLYCRLVQRQAHARLLRQGQATLPGDRRLEVEHLIDAFPEQVKLGQPAIGHASDQLPVLQIPAPAGG